LNGSFAHPPALLLAAASQPIRGSSAPFFAKNVFASQGSACPFDWLDRREATTGQLALPDACSIFKPPRY
jgi:hypothetical protein